jgi:hypothetical protein
MGSLLTPRVVWPSFSLDSIKRIDEMESSWRNAALISDGNRMEIVRLRSSTETSMQHQRQLIAEI